MSKIHISIFEKNLANQSHGTNIQAINNTKEYAIQASDLVHFKKTRKIIHHLLKHQLIQRLPKIKIYTITEMRQAAMERHFIYIKKHLN